MRDYKILLRTIREWSRPTSGFYIQVALGRLALEPLAVLAALCRPDGREILSLNLHPLQTHVPDTELLKQAERNLMTVVAQVCSLCC